MKRFLAYDIPCRHFTPCILFLHMLRSHQNMQQIATIVIYIYVGMVFTRMWYLDQFIFLFFSIIITKIMTPFICCLRPLKLTPWLELAQKIISMQIWISRLLFSARSLTMKAYDFWWLLDSMLQVHVHIIYKTDATLLQIIAITLK